MAGLMALVRLQFISIPALAGVARATLVVSPLTIVLSSFRSRADIGFRTYRSKDQFVQLPSEHIRHPCDESPASRCSKFDALSLLDPN